jgi:hypothetical protein
MRRTEDHHHTPDEVGRYVDEAIQLCNERELDDELRVALLPTLVTLLSSKQLFYEQVAPMVALPGNTRH